MAKGCPHSLAQPLQGHASPQQHREDEGSLTPSFHGLEIRAGVIYKVATQRLILLESTHTKPTQEMALDAKQRDTSPSTASVRVQQ